MTDATAKQAALDKAADFAQKGLAATKPKDMSDADFKTLQTNANPIFYSAIGTAALNKKDTATAITNFKQELAAGSGGPDDQAGTDSAGYVFPGSSLPAIHAARLRQLYLLRNPLHRICAGAVQESDDADRSVLLQKVSRQF